MYSAPTRLCSALSQCSELNLANNPFHHLHHEVCSKRSQLPSMNQADLTARRHEDLLMSPEQLEVMAGLVGYGRAGNQGLFVL
jgi:hypothetical protein